MVIQAGRIRAVAIQAGRMDRGGQAGRMLAVVINQAPRRWKVGESRVPSVAWRKGVVRRWRVIVGSQAAKARPPHNPRREVVAVAVVQRWRQWQSSGGGGGGGRSGGGGGGRGR